MLGVGGFEASRRTGAKMPSGGICAHRGDRECCPENTVAAFKSAIEKGAAMVEFDVVRCATGELVVMHDSTIDRTTTGTGAVSELSFDDLRGVDAGVKYDAKFAGTKIPTFDEAIDCFPLEGVWINVHCRDDVTDEVARKIKEKGRLHQAFVAAGLPGVKLARSVVPEIKTCLFTAPAGNSWSRLWTAEERRACLEAVIDERAEFTQPHEADYTRDELLAYHALGGKVNFFWCNKPWRLAALLARGIDFPLTDRLGPMLKAYRALVESPWNPPEPEFPFAYPTDLTPSRAYVSPPDALHVKPRRRFSGIPSIAVSQRSGRLWATWYSGPTNGEDSNNYVVLSTSADGGATWKEVLVADPDRDGPRRAFDPEVWIAPDGRLRWTWTDREVEVRDGAANQWTTGHYFANTDNLMCLELDADAEPSGVVFELRRIASGVMMCKPLAARDGRWLFPVAVWRDDFSARLYESVDGGSTLVPRGGATLPANLREFDEHNVVELSDGALRVYMRVRGAPDGAWQADSRDGGRTWGPARPCPFRHTNSRYFVRRLASGTLLLVKNGPLNADIGRNDMTAYLSDDDGATWSGGLVLKAGPCSYPDGDQAADGTIFIAFDNDRTGRQELLFAKFTEEDVRAGKPVSGKFDVSGVISVAEEGAEGGI